MLHFTFNNQTFYYQEWKRVEDPTFPEQVYCLYHSRIGFGEFSVLPLYLTPNIIKWGKTKPAFCLMIYKIYDIFDFDSHSINFCNYPELHTVLMELLSNAGDSNPEIMEQEALSILSRIDKLKLFL